MSVTPLPCPDCSTVTEQIEVEGEEVWRCTAPDYTRRTYGTGEVDFEATAELAAHDGPDGDEDQDDDAGSSAPPTAPAADPETREIRVKDLAHVLAGGWVRVDSDPPEGWRHFTEAAYDPGHDTTVTITYSDGEVVREWPWPLALLVHAGSDTIPTMTRPGPAQPVLR